ncbi:hypothetical protein [Allocoleopsis sp.]
MKNDLQYEYALTFRDKAKAIAPVRKNLRDRCLSPRKGVNLLCQMTRL